MKKPLLYLILMLGSLSAISQSVPQKINYQGAARRGDGSTITLRQLGLKFEILQGGPTGNAVYSETQSASTNSLGLFNTTIGTGTFATIDWTAGPYYLSVSVDTASSTNYVFLGTQQMLSVPYALSAGSAPSPALSYNNNILTVGSNSVGIYVGGSSPNLSISGNTLSITGGSASVVLPGAPVLQSGGGATTVSLTPNGYQVHTDSITLGPTVYGYGLLTVAGSYPNYSVGFVPSFDFNDSTGILTLQQRTPYNSLPYSGTPFTFTITPLPRLIGPSLSIGPTSNSVDMSPIAPWRYAGASGPAANTVSLGVTASGTLTILVGINNTTTPTAELEVTGYTKLGGNTAPGIQMAKLTGLTAGLSGTTSISLPSAINPSKILAVSVMADLNGLGNWIPPGYSTALAGLEYYWKINTGTSSIDIINSANSANVLNKNVKILITYEQ